MNRTCHNIEKKTSTLGRSTISWRCASSSFVLLCFALCSLIVWNNTLEAQPLEEKLNAMVSSKPLGCVRGEKTTTFRLFAPRASSVRVALFRTLKDSLGREIPMQKNDDGTWEHSEPVPTSSLAGTYYAYRIEGPVNTLAREEFSSKEGFNSAVLVGDPYSRAVATKNTVRHEARTLILDSRIDEQYNWENDVPVIGANHNDLIIYEAHVRDMTAHPSSGVQAKGSYKGLAELGKKGGLAYLKSLGVNAVEFLPVHEFANIEPAINIYRRNHWGYMTSYFFAPESYYASGASLQKGAWSGADGRAVKELKDLIKALHRQNIAVILDVVYNHVSEFDYNPFKLIDKFYYFHTDSLGNYRSDSYCGNDFKTDRQMARRLIVESVKYWMQEYHIDGFRFDLAAMLDRQTCEEITRAARAINPNVILIAEPWGGNKYTPALFSDISWAAWNDQIRNGVKGQNPHDGLGFIFGQHQGNNTKAREQAFINGTLREDGGLFLRKEHSINYLESHDDETMGDFIRLGLRENSEHERITDIDKHAKLSSRQLALNKLAAMFLFVAQGPVMIHAGQEYARSKVIFDAPGVADPAAWVIDRNSYNKDNATNYLNYQHAAINHNLVDYYKGLIALRKTYPYAFGSASKQDIEFLETGKEFAIAFRVHVSATNASSIKKQTSAVSKNTRTPLLPSASPPSSFIVILNGEPEQPLQLLLPAATPASKAWKVIANADRVSLVKPLGTVSGMLIVPKQSGMILAEWEE